MLDEVFCVQLEATLAQLRRDICDLADCSALDRLRCKEAEKTRLLSRLQANSPQASATLASVCSESVEKGDLDAAFLTVLRYIESISHAKADAEDITGKATRENVESTFEKLAALNAKSVSAKYDELHEGLEKELRYLSTEFDAFASSIDSRVSSTESELSELQVLISRYAGVVSVRRPTSQSSITRTGKSSRPGTAPVDVVSMMTPHRPLKSRTDGIVYPNKPVLRPEPTAKSLMDTVTTISETRKTPKTLIADV